MRHASNLAQRLHRTLVPMALLTIALSGCKPNTPKQAQAPAQRIRIFAPPEMEPIINAAEKIAQDRDPSWRIELVIGGGQSNAWAIEAGELPDLFIASTVAMAEDLLLRPQTIEPWIRDQLVVIARADDPDPIHRSDRAIERSTTPIAVGTTGTKLGDYTRLAMRYAEIWNLVDRRTLQRSNPVLVFESLRSGDADLAIVFASDAAAYSDEFVIAEWLDLPERAQIVFTTASFTELGSEFADLLNEPAILDIAGNLGYTDAAQDSSTED